jgi:acyl-CoA thioester hydrolase
MHKPYHCTLDVRGYELDSFGHVNNAVYQNYYEHARWKMLEEEGITLQTLNDHKRWPVIASAEIKYLRPLLFGQRFEVYSKVTHYKRTSMQIEQEIHLKDEAKTCISKAVFHSVIVNEKGRPDKLPDDLDRLWKHISGAKVHD